MDVLTSASQLKDMDYDNLKGNNKPNGRMNSKPEGSMWEESNVRRGYNNRRPFRGRRGMGGYRGFASGYNSFYNRRPYQSRFMPNRRPRRMMYGQEGPFQRGANVFSFLGNVEGNKIEADQLKKAEKLSTILLTLKLPTRPLTAFQTFVNDMRKDDDRKTIQTIRKMWDELSEKEKTERGEKAWNLLQEYNVNKKEYNKKRLELENELRALQGKPVLMARDTPVKGYDLYWKDVEAKILAEMPKATAYSIEMKRVELWKALPKNEKNVYIIQSLIEREKALHARKLIMLASRMQAAKDSLAAPAAAAK